jgi:hypothetical protein
MGGSTTHFLSLCLAFGHCTSSSSRMTRRGEAYPPRRVEMARMTRGGVHPSSLYRDGHDTTEGRNPLAMSKWHDAEGCTLLAVSKCQDAEGYAPPRHIEMATIRRGGYAPPRRVEMAQRGGACMPLHVVSKWQQHGAEGHTTPRRVEMPRMTRGGGMPLLVACRCSVGFGAVVSKWNKIYLFGAYLVAPRCLVLLGLRCRTGQQQQRRCRCLLDVAGRSCGR